MELGAGSMGIQVFSGLILNDVALLMAIRTPTRSFGAKLPLPDLKDHKDSKDPKALPNHPTI